MPRVMPLYYHYSNESSICDAFDNTHVQYTNDTLDIIRSVFKPKFIHYTKYAKYAFLLLFSIETYFTVTSAIRSSSALGSVVSEAVVGETLYWTIDIPGNYCNTIIHCEVSYKIN